MFALIPPPYKQYIEAALFALIVTGAGLFYWHYQHLAARAAQADVYEKQIAAEHEQADQLAALLAKVDGLRTDFDNRLTDWQGLKGDVLSSINGALRRTPAATLAVCAPTPDDRRMFNDAIAKLLGSGLNPAPAPVPAAAGTPH